MADTLEGSYTYDNEGRMITQTYPGAQPVGGGGGADVPGETFVYAFDAMGRPIKMGGPGVGNDSTWISGVTYNAAGQPLAITTTNGQVAGETREYNVLGQLTRIVSGNFEFRYNFSLTANDGRITSQSSYSGGVLQETVNYSYDSLNRLTGASTSAGTSSWSATYTYDGFTNLLGVTSSGTGPVPSPMSITVNPATNRRNDWTYDANGNVTAKSGFTGDYDVENRLQRGVGPGGEEVYGYGPDNRRLYVSKLNAGGAIQEIVTWWSGGKRAGRYEMVWTSATNFAFRTVDTNVWFGGKPLKLGTETGVVADRLGSVRRGSGKDYFPYGQENAATPTTTGDKEKYATYLQDGRTDLAYADQRYYAPGSGRFMTADPAQGSADLANPSSLNRYSYVNGDPVNYLDPNGHAACGAEYSFEQCFGMGGPNWHGFMPWESPYSCWEMITRFEGNGVNHISFHPTCAPHMQPGMPLMMAAMAADALFATRAAQAIIDKNYLDCLNDRLNKLDAERTIAQSNANAQYNIEAAANQAQYVSDVATYVAMAKLIPGSGAKEALIAYISATAKYVIEDLKLLALRNQAIAAANDEHRRKSKEAEEDCKKQAGKT